MPLSRDYLQSQDQKEELGHPPMSWNCSPPPRKRRFGRRIRIGYAGY
jgi:hypothetical protein